MQETAALRERIELLTKENGRLKAECADKERHASLLKKSIECGYKQVTLSFLCGWNGSF